MSINIKIYKKKIESTRITTLLENKRFFLICIKKVGSTEHCLTFFNKLKKSFDIDIKTFKKKPVLQSLKQKMPDSFSTVLEGPVSILYFKKNNKIDILNLLSSIKKSNFFSTLTCYVDSQCHLLSHVEHMSQITTSIKHKECYELVLQTHQSVFKTCSIFKKQPYVFLGP